MSTMHIVQEYVYIFLSDFYDAYLQYFLFLKEITVCYYSVNLHFLASCFTF